MFPWKSIGCTAGPRSTTGFIHCSLGTSHFLVARQSRLVCLRVFSAHWLVDLRFLRCSLYMVRLLCIPGSTYRLNRSLCPRFPAGSSGARSLGLSVTWTSGPASLFTHGLSSDPRISRPRHSRVVYYSVERAHDANCGLCRSPTALFSFFNPRMRPSPTSLGLRSLGAGFE